MENMKQLKWLKAIKRPFLTNITWRRVCGDHFREYQWTSNKAYIKPNAIPTCNIDSSKHPTNNNDHGQEDTSNTHNLQYPPHPPPSYEEALKLLKLRKCDDSSQHPINHHHDHDHGIEDSSQHPINHHHDHDHGIEEEEEEFEDEEEHSTETVSDTIDHKCYCKPQPATNSSPIDTPNTHILQYPPHPPPSYGDALKLGKCDDDVPILYSTPSVADVHGYEGRLPGYRPIIVKCIKAPDPKIEEKLNTLKKENRKLKKKLAQRIRRSKLREAKLKGKVNELIKQIKKLTVNLKDPTPNEIVNHVSKYLKGSSFTFFKLQITQNKKKKNGRRYTYLDKIFSITLYYQSPKCYRFLRKSFILPNKRTISNWLKDVQFKAGFNEDIFDVLREKVEKMKQEERVCCLLLDEVSLKEGLSYDRAEDGVEGVEDFGMLGKTKTIANHGLVFMVRGLYTNWKQPLCYFLCRDCTSGAKLAELIKLECIKRLFEIGLIVKSCICDQGTNNRVMFEEFKITDEKPFITMSMFEHVKEENPLYTMYKEKIYFLYDPPHLLKNIRNNLHNHDIQFGDKIAKWSHIESFYLKEKERGHMGYKAAFKLTDKHIYLPAFSRMSVKRAAQVLSHSVASGISSHVALGDLPAEAIHTAEFCERMDQLFNSFNSQSKRAPLDKKWKNACSSKSNHTTRS
ncbi:uncharacterized protein [Amphiura filiformis]|uniref:uncharacterized protein n=1 Tax=Amphiura filiformis TaxID=82378 RepID=UPI003B21158B